jgi:hypothetical protein
MSQTSSMLGDEVETGKPRTYADERLAADQYVEQQVIKQGYRRRHPNRVLQQFHGVNATTSEAGDLYTKSLIHETKRVEVPKDFRPRGDTDFMANQMGVVATAFTNFKASKKKLERMMTVGS